MFAIRCHFDLQGPSDFISSESSEYCDTASWVITVPLYQNIRLQFETFQLSDLKESGPHRIHIYDGLYTNNTLLGVFTGVRRPFIIQSSGRYMLVKLTKELRSTYSTLSNFKGVYTFGTAKGILKNIIGCFI